MTKLALKTLLSRKKGVLLDVSLGGTPQPRSVSLSPKGDIPFDPTWRALQPHFTQKFPLPDDCVHTAVVTHILEYVAPQLIFAWFDELWRIVQPYGTVYISGPYGGDDSLGWLSDPTHQTRILESSYAWLDPRTPLYELHASLGRKTPKPWHPQAIARVPGTQGSISINAVLQKQPMNGHAR